MLFQPFWMVKPGFEAFVGVGNGASKIVDICFVSACGDFASVDMEGVVS